MVMSRFSRSISGFMMMGLSSFRVCFQSVGSLSSSEGLNLARSMTALTFFAWRRSTFRSGKSASW